MSILVSMTRSTRLILLLPAAFMPTLVGCDKGTTHTDEPDSAAATRPLGIATGAPGQHASFDRMWRKVAAEHDILPSTMEMVSRLVADLLAWRNLDAESIELAYLYPSLDRYLSQYKPWLDDPRSREGAAYWTAYCLVRSLERGSRSIDCDDLREYYLTLVDRAATIMERGIRSNLPDDLQGKMDSVIKEGMQHIRHECGIRLSRYVTDPLCPAFHARPSEQGEKGFLERYGNTRNLPAPEEPVGMMVTAEEASRNQFKNYIQNEIGLLLFDLFIRSLDAPLNKTEYWGYMDYRAQSADGILRATDTWPAIIRFVPNPIYNDEHGWTRKQFGKHND